MATSATYTWNPTIADIIGEAYELAGWDGRSARDLITARRSINLIFSDWANWGVNLWTLEQISTDLVSGTRTYNLTSRTIDVLEAVTRKDDLDRPLERISIEEYHTLPDKLQTGRPTQFALTRGQSVPVLHLYPVPDDSTVDFVAWQIRYMQDAASLAQNPDVPRRFLPALIYRLAYEVSLKKKVNATDAEAAKEDRERRAELFQIAQGLFERAREEDSDAANLFLRPRTRP